MVRCTQSTAQEGRFRDLTAVLDRPILTSHFLWELLV